MCWRGGKIACKRFVILRLFEWCLWEWKELGVMIVWEMSQKFFLLLFWYCMNVFDTFYSRNWFETILEWNLIVRMKWVLVKKDSWCWLIFQHPDWESCSESSGDWKFKGIYWFVVGRVLWLVLRTVNGDWCIDWNAPICTHHPHYQSKCRPGHHYICLNFQSSVTWLWRWLPLRMLKCQSPPTVLFRTDFTAMIKFHPSTFHSVFNVSQSGLFSLDSWHL